MAKQKPLISIIVPVYNVEKYLNKCVDSILEQTFKDFELILVDDGSSDQSPDICDKYAAVNKNIKVFHQVNKGQAKARKVGLIAAKGEYVFFVDSDDWLEPDALEVACDCALKNDADIVTFDAYFNYSYHRVPVKQPVKSGCFDKKGLIKHIYPKMIYSGRFFYFGIYAAMWNKIFRRSIVEPNMLNVDERIRIGEDGVATFATFLDANKVCVLGGKYLYNYRDNNLSMTRSYFEKQFNNTVLLIDALRKINKQKNIYDLTKQIDYYFMYNIYSIFIEEFYYRYKKSLPARYKYLKEITEDKAIRQISGTIITDDMLPNFKAFFKLLSSGKTNRLIANTILIALKKRSRVYLRKLLNRY